MSLVIEEGSVVEGASSYVGIAEVRAYATARASALPSDDATLEAAIVRAADYLESLGHSYKGDKADPLNQCLQWPRIFVDFNGVPFPPNVIPRELKSAQCQAAIEAAGGLDLMPTGDGREVIHEKVDVIETDYSPGSSGGSPQPRLVKVLAILSPLLRTSGFSCLQSTRV